MVSSLLTPEDRKLLRETRELLEDVLETEEVLSDPKLMASLKEAEGDVRAGRIDSMDELKDELRKRGKL